MSKEKAKIYLHTMINKLYSCIGRGSYITYQDIINQCEKAIKELED